MWARPSKAAQQFASAAAVERDVRGHLIASQNVTDAPWTMGLPFAEGEVPAGWRVTSPSHAAFQVVVKNRWHDGSIKFAIASGLSTQSAGQRRPVRVQAKAPELALPQVDATTGDIDEVQLHRVLKSAVLSFGNVGSVDLKTLLGRKATRNPAGSWQGGLVSAWLSGPVMSSWLYAAPIGADPHLMAWFEVRLYRNGALHVLPWLENGFIKIPGCSGHVQTLEFSLNGISRFSMPVHLVNHGRLVAQSGPGVGHWTGPEEPLVALPDPVCLQASRLIPTYMGQTVVNGATTKDWITGYSPAVYGQIPERTPGKNHLGRYPSDMGTAGYHLSIGLLPEWDALYITTQAHPAAWQQAMAQAFGAGRYSIHDRDEATLRPLKFSDWPTLGIGSGPRGVSSVATNSKGDLTSTVRAYRRSDKSDINAEKWATSHHPSVGYLAYILTGHLHFLETAQFSATVAYLKQSVEERQGPKCIIPTGTGANTTRGAAWALRSLALAAAATPDDSPLSAEFVGAVNSNIIHYHQRYIERNLGGPMGFCKPYNNYKPQAQSPQFVHAVWMEDFLTAVFGWIGALALPSTPELRRKYHEFFDWKARSVVGRLGRPGYEAEFGYTHAAAYTMVIAPTNSPSSWEGTGPWFSNWGDVFKATNGTSNRDNRDAKLQGAYFPEPTGYWGNMIPAIAYAVAMGVKGAAEGYGRLTSAPNWREFVAAAGRAPVWAIGVPPARR